MLADLSGLYSTDLGIQDSAIARDGDDFVRVPRAVWDRILSMNEHLTSVTETICRTQAVLDAEYAKFSPSKRQKSGDFDSAREGADAGAYDDLF
tara:strand:- start:1952 stop:2233 length:282 start_codon:yes stop_codon:yes gene_type:complete